MSQPPMTGPASVTEEDDFVFMSPLWRVVRRYRRWLELAFFASLILGGSLLGAAYISLPKKVRAGLEFTLTFPGASLGTYPNKQPFRPGELLETSLLFRNYEKNGLATFLSFEEFKSGLSLERSGSDFELLKKEFRARLADRKLTLADREKIEAQFKAQLKSLRLITYRLNFIQTARPARLIPPARQTKVLEDILRLWSDDAVLKKKVLNFAARVPSEIPLPEKGIDPLMALMEMVERTRVLADVLAELSRLPGGYQVSLGDGAKLTDLLLQLQALQEIRIPQVRSALYGNVADPAQAEAIERVFRLQVRMREDRLRLAREKLLSYISTYRDYLASRLGTSAPAARPNPEGVAAAGSGAGTQLQIGDTFFAKLLELGRGNDDAQYRATLVDNIRGSRLGVVEEESALRETREIVEGLVKDFAKTNKAAPPAKPREPAPNSVENRTDFAAVLLLGCRELNALIVESEKLRGLLLKNYVNPRTSLYRINIPVLADQSSFLTPLNIGLFLAAFVFLGVSLTLLACYLHDQSSKPQT